MGSLLRQRATIDPTALHCLRRGPRQWTITCADIQEQDLLYYLPFHLHHRGYDRRPSTNAAEVWISSKFWCFHESYDLLRRVSHSRHCRLNTSDDMPSNIL